MKNYDDAIKKKYIGIWENRSKICIEKISAENINEARIIMVYLMKYYGGDQYELDDIKLIIEVDNNYYIDYQATLNKFKMAKRNIPQLKNAILFKKDDYNG